MREPSIRTSRLVIAGGLAAVLAVGGAGFFLGRLTAPVTESASPVVVRSPMPASSRAGTPKVLRRVDLIALAQQASDAQASGNPLPEDVKDAAGERFELLLPFGCSGASEEDNPQSMKWRYDQDRETLRVSVTPIKWIGQEWGIENIPDVEAKGFWIARPWSSSEVCPGSAAQAVPSGTEPITLPGQTLAIAQFLRSEEGNGLSRDGRPFEIVRRVASGKFDGSKGFRLRITGRIDGNLGPVRCVQPAGAEQRPICVISGRIDELRIENAATEEMLASWPIG